ncbi:MAG: ABC transporter permease, partial [Acidobacteriota bacterium]
LETSENAARIVRGHIRSYAQRVGSLRLMVRGVDPNVAQPIAVQLKDYSTRTSRGSLALLTLQLIFLMAAFFGGAGVAVDATAGERERKSWEPLLVHPLRSTAIAGGKWLAVVVFAATACLLSLVASAVALKYFSLEALGIAPHLPLSMLASLFALQIPLVFFASALQMLVSIFAKTFKEAQGFLGLLTLLPMLPVVISMFKETQTATWTYLVPVAGQQQLMTDVMRGEGLDALGYALSTSITMALTVVIFTTLAKLLRSERVVFGG